MKRLLALLLCLPALVAAQTAPPSQWSSGVLSVPFKMHMDGTVSPGGTAGAYLGYQFEFMKAISLTPVVSTGISAISSASTAQSGKTFSTVGMTAASGVVGQFLSGSKLHFGLLVGIDWTGRGIVYEYSGKPYLSFSIGYPLTQ